MPLYEYVCSGCGKKFEAYVRAWGETVSCPACQGSEVVKQLSSFGLAGSEGGPSSPAGGCGCGRGACGCH